MCENEAACQSMPVDKSPPRERFRLVVPRPHPLCHCFFVRGSLPRSVWPDSSPSFLSHGRVKGLVNLQREELETTPARRGARHSYLAVVQPEQDLILLKTNGMGWEWESLHLANGSNFNRSKCKSKGIPLPVKVFTPSFILLVLQNRSSQVVSEEKKREMKDLSMSTNCFVDK